MDEFQADNGFKHKRSRVWEHLERQYTETKAQHLHVTKEETESQVFTGHWVLHDKSMMVSWFFIHNGNEEVILLVHHESKSKTTKVLIFTNAARNVIFPESGFIELMYC